MSSKIEAFGYFAQMINYVCFIFIFSIIAISMIGGLFLVQHEYISLYNNYENIQNLSVTEK